MNYFRVYYIHMMDFAHYLHNQANSHSCLFRPLFSRPISWLRQLSDRSQNRSSTEDNETQSIEQNNSWRNIQCQRSEGGNATMMPKESRQLYSTNHMQNSESAKHCSGYTEKSIYKADIEKNDMIDNTNSTDSKALEEIDLS